MLTQALLAIFVSAIVLFALAISGFGFVLAQPGISGIAIAVFVTMLLDRVLPRSHPVPYFGHR